MNKRTILLPALASAGLLMMAAPSQAAMDPYIEGALVQVCKETMQNDRLGLSSTMQEYRLRYPTVVQKVVCNGEEIYDFAQIHGADKTAAMLRKRGRLGIVTIRDVAMADNEKWYVNF
ncbi:DUF3718 domain-containing protein [Gallaecimonas sp. GXIMD4217]|uniref:DUF3718 domain-containing protein n=1 Tax=Gallaecimonas sp. GXIMD4217 TaxID=3131927 RepID=UPI00311B270F